MGLYEILLVDDEKYFREGFKNIINWQECGFRISGEANNGEEAIRFIEKNNPHLVITDIRMPIMDGLELIKETNHRGFNNVKFMVLSGHDEFYIAKTAMRYGVKKYILKPIEEDEVHNDLKELYFEISEEERTQDEFKVGKNTLIYNLLYEILRGSKDRDKISQIVKYINCKEFDKPIRCLMVKIDRYNLIDTRKRLYDYNFILELTRLISIEIGSNEKRNVFYDEGIFDIIIFGKEQPINILELGSKIQNLIKNHTGMTVTVLIGKEVNEFSSISESFNSVIETNKYRFYMGNNSIIQYDDIKDNNMIYSILNCEEHFNVLVESIEKNDYRRIDATVSTICKELKESLVAPEAIKVCVNNLIFELTKILKDMNGDVEKVVSELPFMRLDFDTLTIFDLEKNLTFLSKKFSEQIMELRKQKSLGLINIVEEYIKENFNKDITLTNLSEHFHINPVYLGQLFKKSYGVLFNDYLYDLRIDEAKKLLRRKNLRIYEIASMVGYKDSDYFTNKFEKKVGVTPNQYRKRFFE